jgi:hypothetical protein
MKKEICFDMDGTLADFYGVENWLQYLIDHKTTPYEIAKPLFNFSVLARYLNRLQKQGYTLTIISWLSKDNDMEYGKQVTTAKLNWLKRHLKSVKWDNIYILPYGTSKQDYGKGILFDDEKGNRDNWTGGKAYDVDNILEILKSL